VVEMVTIGDNITTVILFTSYILFIILILLYFSSIAAMLLMTALPLTFLLLLPEQTASFLSYRQLNIINNKVPLYNLHILLFIWTGLFSIITYSELVTWYLSKTSTLKKAKAKKTLKNKTTEPHQLKKTGKQVNIPFKPLENLLIKLENLLSKNKT
jgi:predicted membrane protein